METMRDDLDKHIDFGADADAVAQPDPAFDAWIEKVAPTLNAPGATPRAEMWTAIQAARKTAQDAEAGRIPGVVPLRRNHWRLMSLIAAALLLGVALDRMVLRPAEHPTGPVATKPTTATTPTTPTDSSDPARLYRMAAAQTLTQAEALLTAFRASGAGSANPVATQQLGRWGRDIVSSTRLLLDSPAGADPRLRALLEDLELVLVQIIQLSGAPLDTTDRAIIERALEDRELLPRIRTAVPAGVTSAADAATDD
jgi:hypothetical protein